jgi:hypothetical protein
MFEQAVIDASFTIKRLTNLQQKSVDICQLFI